MSSIDQPIFYWGVVCSCLVGCIAIKFMIQYVKRFGFLSFAIYRLIMAGIILASVKGAS